MARLARVVAADVPRVSHVPRVSVLGFPGFPSYPLTLTSNSCRLDIFPPCPPFHCTSVSFPFLKVIFMSG